MLRIGVMVVLDKNLSDEELDALLNDMGLSEAMPITEDLKRETSIEKLLEEMIDLPKEPPQIFPIQVEKTSRSRLKLWLTLALLSGFLMGAVFGFFLRKNPMTTHFEEKFEGVSTQLQELRETLNEALIPFSEQNFPKMEIIEAIEPLKEIEELVSGPRLLP